MNRLDAAKIISGVGDFETKQASAPTNVHIITGEVGATSEDGKVTVAIDGLVFSDDEEQFVEFDTLGGLEEGDTATILLTGESGHAMVPLAIGGVGTVDRIVERVGQLYVDYAEIGELVAEKATISDLNAATARIDDLEADTADISDLVATKATISDLNAATARIDDLEADTADISDLVATKAAISDLNAATARIGDLEADHVSVSDFQAEQANIDSLQAATADISTIRANSAKVANLTAQELEADHATIAALDSNYVTTDFLNADVGWIENGIIKDGSISSAMINSLSANKLSAGTINGSVITVTNLNADNITAGTINGQRIGQGSLSLDKLAEDVYTEAEVDALLDTMQAEIDGAIETWTGTAVPTLSNAPANGWTTNKIKDTHVGDVYFVVNSNSQQNGYNYRFSKSTSGGQTTYSWQLIKDSDVTAALQRLTTAEGKIGTIEQFDSDISAWKTDTDEELSSMKTAHNDLAGRVTTAEGTLATKVDTTTFNEVKQTVDENSSSITQLTTTTTELRADLDGIEIGGRNLLLATAGGATTAGSTNQSVYTKSWALSDYGQSVMDNTDDIFTWSFDYEVTGNEATGAQIYAQIRGSAIVTPDIHGVSRNRYVHDNPTGHYSCSVHLTSTQVSSTTQSCRIRLQSATDGAVLRVWNVKIEKGTKGSDWTAAPEDLESTVTTVSNKVSEHTQTIEGFTTRIGALETTIETKADGSTVESVSNRLNAVSDTVDGHTQTISSVQDTLETKADSSTVSTLTTKVNTVSDTVDGHTSQLGRIQTRVENSDPNMLLDWNAPSKAKVDAKVGRYFSNSAYTEITPSFFAVADPPMVGIENGVRFVCDGSAHTAGRGRGLAFYDENLDTALAFVDGQSYTASWWARCTEGSGQTYCLYVDGGTSTTKHNGRRDLTSEWQLFTETFKPVKCSDYGSRVWFYSWFAANVSGTIELCGFKLVPGESAESVATTVTTLSTDYAEYKQTTEEFKTTVGETYATKVELADQVSVRFKLMRNKWTDAQWSTYEAVGYSTSYQNKHFYTNSDTATETGFDATKVKVGDYILIEGVSTDSKSPHFLMARITSVPTAAGNGFPATTVAGVNSTQLATRVSQAETAIDQNKDAIALRATKTEAYQVAQPNLTPYFSMPMTANSDDYWYALTSSRFTQLEDGWAHFENNNTGSSTLNHYINPRVIDTLVPGGKYTLLAEFRNVSVTGSTSGNFYSQQSTGSQIWGASDATGGFTISNAALAALEGGAGVFYKSLTTLDAESKDPSGTVRGTLPKGSFMSINQQVVAGQSISYDIRLSLYEGEYAGPYKPYSGPQLYATNAELKVTADGISTEVSKKVGASEIISKINQSAETVKIQASKVEIDGTAVFSAISSDVDDAITSKGYQTASQVNSAITSKGYATTTQAQGYATTAKSEAISSAATDATTKANAAETNAKAYTDALEIGGRNLLRNSLEMKLGTSSWKNGVWRVAGNADMTKSHVEISDGPLGQCGGLQLVGTQTTTNDTSCYGIDSMPRDVGGDYVISMFARVVGGGVARAGFSIYSATYADGNDDGRWAAYYTKTLDATGKWTRIWKHWKSTAIKGNVYIGGAATDTSSKTIQMCFVQIERGTKPTDWTPAPEEMVRRTQRIWYRTNASGAPSTPGTASSNWVTKADDGNDAWTKMHIAISSTHKYIYTCEQYEMANGTVGYTSVLLDNTITVIDGGNIITGTVSANAINATSGTFAQANIPALTADHIKANVISAVNNGTGTINADKINVSGITIGYDQVEDTPTIPSTVAELSDASDYAKQSALTAEINQRKAAYATSSTAAGTQGKVANCANFALYTGASVTVTFSNANTHATPTLNVNSTGAKSIRGYTGAALTAAEYKWAAGAAITFVYDGSYWRMQDGGAQQAKADAASSASAASTSATNAATSASNASTSATNAANSASTASTKAGEASTSATNAASSASTASSKATAASNSASAASTSATNAANSATSASNSASSASTSATNAATSATKALDAAAGWYAECTTDGATTAKVATITPATTNFTLTKGVVVHVKFSNLNSGAVGSLTLNVNSTGAKSIKYISSGGTIANLAAANWLRANVTYEFYYDGTYWIAQQSYNTNDYDRENYKAELAASTTISSGRIAVLGTDGKLKLLNASAFDYSGPILYVATAYSADDVSDGTKRTTNYTFWGTTFTLTNTHSIANAAAGSAVYIVGTVSGKTFTPNSTVLTCKVPTTKDNLVYIRLGLMSSTTAAVLEADHPMYMFFNGAFQQCDAATANAACTATNYITHVDNNGITIHPQSGASNRVAIDADGMEVFKGNVSVASYGDTARIGKVAGPRVVIETDKLSMYAGSDGGTLAAEIKTFVDDYEGVHGEISTDFIKATVFYTGGGDATYLSDGGLYIHQGGLATIPSMSFGTLGYQHLIDGINFGFSSATTNSNGVTTFNPDLGVKPTAVFVAPGKASNETEAVAKIAVPMVWSIDSATQVQVRWQRSDTNAWLVSNAVGWYWLALYSRT